MKRRERARQMALQALYQLDVRGETVGAETVDFLRGSTRDPETYFFARRLAEGAWGWREEADRLIEAAAEHWRVARMAAVDRNILRLATWEICRAPDIPERVSIDQAIELAKAFSTAEAPGFVNGVLDRVLHLAREQGLVAEEEDEGDGDRNGGADAGA
ncbi:MAG: transcription antitermination factor NusB [Phycisphaerae bacterium]